MPGIRNLELYQGDTFTLHLKLTKMVDGVKVPWDLTGHVGAAQIRRSHKDEVAHDFTVDIPSPQLGEVVIAMTAEQTVNLPPKGVWDVQTTDPDGVVRTWVHGTTNLTPEVTR